MGMRQRRLETILCDDRAQICYVTFRLSPFSYPPFEPNLNWYPVLSAHFNEPIRMSTITLQGSNSGITRQTLATLFQVMTELSHGRQSLFYTSVLRLPPALYVKVRGGIQADGNSRMGALCRGTVSSAAGLSEAAGPCRPRMCSRRSPRRKHIHPCCFGDAATNVHMSPPRAAPSIGPGGPTAPR